MNYEAVNQYLLRPEDCEYLYFPIHTMMVGRGYAGDDPIDIEKEIGGPQHFTIVYKNLNTKVDNKWVFRCVGACK